MVEGAGGPRKRPEIYTGGSGDDAESTKPSEVKGRGFNRTIEAILQAQQDSLPSTSKAKADSSSESKPGVRLDISKVSLKEKAWKLLKSVRTFFSNRKFAKYESKRAEHVASLPDDRQSPNTPVLKSHKPIDPERRYTEKALARENSAQQLVVMKQTAALAILKDHQRFASNAQKVQTTINRFESWDESKLIHRPGPKTRDIHADPLRQITTDLQALKSLPEDIKQQLSVTPEQMLDRKIAGLELQEWGTQGAFQKSGASLDQVKRDFEPLMNDLVKMSKQMESLS